MKIQLLLAIMIVCINNFCKAQITQIFQPGPGNCFDVSITDYFPNTQMLADEFNAVAWTCNSTNCNVRSLIRFDLSSVPSNATLTGAFLSLYAHQNQSTGSNSLGPTYGSANQCKLSQVLMPWTPATTTWNNQPPASSINYVFVPQSISSNQNYINVDVTSLCQLAISNPATNYGWLFQLENETYYNGLIFGSGEYPDSTLRPKLIIIYSVPNGINAHSSQNNCNAYFDKSSQSVKLKFENPLKSNVTITLYDVTGRTIVTKSTDESEVSFFNLNNSNGLFFYKLFSTKSNETLQGKILVMP